MFTFNKLIVVLLWNPLAIVLLDYLLQRYFRHLPEDPMVFWLTSGLMIAFILAFIQGLILFGTNYLSVCAIASSLDMT